MANVYGRLSPQQQALRDVEESGKANGRNLRERENRRIGHQIQLFRPSEATILNLQKHKGPVVKPGLCAAAKLGRPRRLSLRQLWAVEARSASPRLSNRQIVE